jgi:TrmH family RNA methyltransferase
MISSKDNPKLKQARALLADQKARRAQGAFVVEGVRLVEEALSSGWEIEWGIFTTDLGERGLALLPALARRGILMDEVPAGLLAAVSDTQTPQGILVVIRNRPLPLPKKMDFALILDELRDPGNLGAILRTAAAAGVDAVLLAEGSVDPFSPKVLRAGMGAHFRLPIQLLAWDEIRRVISHYELSAYLATSYEGQVYTAVDFAQPSALVIGGEAQGASSTAQQAVTRRVCIPMPGGGDSLNAAAAAAILLFEVVRQRTAM